MEALRAEYEALVPRMIEDRTEEIEGVLATICVRPLLCNKQGRFALRIAQSGSGNWAIHEINQDGSFSRKGPYWLKVRQDAWRYEGNYAEVILLLARDGANFQIKHPYQDEGVHRIGYRVIEFNTAKRPVIEWKDFRWMRGF